MIEEHYNYLPILIQLLLAVGISLGIIFVSHLFGQKATRNKFKDSAYECGLVMDGKPHPKFSVKFYVTAMLFILFDIEVIFMIPWVMVYRDFLANAVPVFLPIMFFLFVLVLGLVYEIKKGALKWER
jgi:NADH-quinone oxidoreductase subunit A